MRYFLFLTLLALTACGPAEPDPAALLSSSPAGIAASPGGADYDPSRDYFTQANYRQFRLQHLVLDLNVDFAQQQLQGQADLHLLRLDKTADEIILDSRGLQVESVSLRRDGLPPEVWSFVLGETQPVLGEAIRIALPTELRAVAEFTLQLRYRTGPNPSAIMWLEPQMTAGGEQPFMFTQSQAIHARSWVPLQDTPAVRFSYQARINTPPNLLAVMSADNDSQAARGGEYEFSMPQPIPSYLLALAVGNLYFSPFGERTGVYAEPEVLERAAWEFADTEDTLLVAEANYGPYEWGRYDLLILPPSFPYGGMENPRLSFITPSVLAGDRSVVSLIAHELAHSWSGNLVSNATWRDIWLNEGTTSYLETRLMEGLFGKERADEERVLTYLSLLEQLQETEIEMQALAPRMDSGDPDVGQGGLEFGKGQLLLETLEARFGRELFDAYLTGYFQHFAWQAITTEQFLEYIDEHLLQQHPGIYSRAELEQWLEQPGIPETAQIPVSAGLDDIGELSRAWALGEVASTALPASEWSPQGYGAIYQRSADGPQ
ncbi:MAG: M1 family aminopeptidase/hydrolase [Xanthomonadales bacterium]|nr:M1 family aminopeptidase/hydrolase [Xanthomonadales bacterium]